MVSLTGFAPAYAQKLRREAGDLLHERQACWPDYTTGTEMVRASGNAPSFAVGYGGASRIPALI